MRPKERRDSGQADLLRSRLDAIIDTDHALVKLARTKQALTVAGDLRPDRPRKRHPMVSPFRYD
jgi:hypothetical protein